MEQAYKLFFGTLTSEIRLKIINSLRKSPKTVSELQEITKLEQSIVSHNLKRLKKCGFVEVKKNGQYRVYHLNKETIEPIMKTIDNHMHKHCIKIIKGEK